MTQKKEESQLNIESCSTDEKHQARLEYKREYQKAYRASGKDAIVRKAANKRTRIKVLEGYGSKCNCCGESELVFLAIDHVNNDGNKERKVGLTSIATCYKIIRENFPPEYQLLCHNCNWAKHRGGCPYQNKE